MKTSNQAIRNLGRHARHVATIGFTSLGLAAVLSGPVSAQTHHSGERSDDFTMMPRNMTPLQPTDCSTGKIAVGSTCVDVSASSNSLPWTSYFLGQKKCKNSMTDIVCLTINSNGELILESISNYPAVVNTCVDFSCGNQRIYTSLGLPNFNERLTTQMQFMNSVCNSGDPNYVYTPYYLGFNYENIGARPLGITINNGVPSSWEIVSINSGIPALGCS